MTTGKTTNRVPGTLPGMPPTPQPAAMTAEQLRNMMRRAGVASQAALAGLLDVHRVTVNRWLNGKTPINAAVAALVRERLGKKLK